MIKKLKTKIFILIFFVTVSALGYFFFKEEKRIFLEVKEGGQIEEIKIKPTKIKAKSPFSGLSCEHFDDRSFGIVFHQAPEAMPLFGIQRAEIVIEAPYTNPGGVTRLLAIYQCQKPGKIGPLRSLRPFMIDLGLGFDSILVSWGASSEAAKRARALRIDWFTPIIRPFGRHAFFRAKNIPAPHNAFVNLEALKKEAARQKLRIKNEFSGYQFTNETFEEPSHLVSEIKINYHYPVKWIFDPQSKAYLRFWNNKEAKDGETQKRILAKNILLLKTDINVLRPGVAEIKTIGEGEARVYQNGREIKATWKKKDLKAKLSFFDEEGKEIKFLPGNIWIEIVDKF